MRIATTLALATTLAVAGWETVPASDRIQLRTGGSIHGQWLNADAERGADYVVELPGGGRVTLERDRVERVERTPETKRAYERLLGTLPDTAAAHWEMAERCTRAGMRQHAQFHLEQVLRWDSDHEGARRALGYRRFEGRWIQPEAFMRDQGYVRHGNAWRTIQEAELLAKTEQHDQQVRQWRRQIMLWRDQILKQRGDPAQAEARLRSIDDPLAAPVFVDLLQEQDEPLALQSIYIDRLGQLPSPAAIDLFVRLSLEHNDANVREACLGHLKRLASRQATLAFIRQLQSNDNRTVQRAAIGLARMGDAEAVLPLIDALVTTHRQVVQPSGGGTQVAFGSDGSGGLTAGGRPQVIERRVQNDQVLAALTRLNSEVNFGFDQSAWRQWYARRNTPPEVNLRRGD